MTLWILSTHPHLFFYPEVPKNVMWLFRNTKPSLVLPDDQGSLSFQFSRSVVSDSLQPHESQHARPPCPSPTPGVYSNSCPSSRWCHPAISSSVVPFSCPQSLWVFPVHQAQALVSCIQPRLVICFTLDNIHVLMLFSRNILPSPSPTESKSLFYTSVSLFLFCI